MAKIIRISKEEAMRRLGDVPAEKRFLCHDGRFIKNLGELEKALNNMSEETFLYHSGEGRKDFSKWVREVVGDDRLANELAMTKSRTEASRVVARRISFLQSKI
ncbi:MAG: hypothetical protein ACUVTR_00715 [Dehalococcoidia bacterium]